jgi:hypothetical protein
MFVPTSDEPVITVLPMLTPFDEMMPFLKTVAIMVKSPLALVVFIVYNMYIYYHRE